MSRTRPPLPAPGELQAGERGRAPGEPRRQPGAVKAIEAYVGSLGLDAYVVGGVVRDELLGRESSDVDFLVAGLDSAGLRAVLSRFGRVDELSVAGRTVGLRLQPGDPALRALAPAGIEFAPLRRERSTGAGRHDFEIVVDPAASVADDLARRDFTVNAIARRLSDGSIVDPYGGRDDLARGVLRTVSPRSFAEDPLRLVRGLRFVSELGLEPDLQTLAQMRAQADAIALVSAERIGGGLAADGMGELSKLLLGAEPEKALTLASEVGVLQRIVPGFGATIGLQRGEGELSLDRHLLRTVQLTAEAGRPLRVRLAALLHERAAPGDPADAAGETLERLRYPNALRRAVMALVAAQPLLPGDADARTARRELARHGDELAADLVALREADLGATTAAGPVDAEELARLVAFGALLETQRAQPHLLSQLAVDGGDLIELGFSPGPPLGQALATLLAEVVAEPERNRRPELLARARELLAP